MNLIYLLIVGIICFGAILIGGKNFRFSVLYTLAIGGAVNANFFHANAYPINCFGLPFGIDSIIYTLFIFSVIVMYLKYDRKSAIVLTLSTVSAILFSAVMQFVSDIASNGYSLQALIYFANFLVSAVASLIAIYVMLFIMDKLKNKNVNPYVIIVVAIVCATLINSALYYGLSALINAGLGTNFWQVLLASIIGKIIALGLSLLTYLLLEHLEKNKNQKLENN